MIYNNQLQNQLDNDHTISVTQQHNNQFSMTSNQLNNNLHVMRSISTSESNTTNYLSVPDIHRSTSTSTSTSAIYNELKPAHILHSNN